MDQGTRLERDPMGEVRVPEQALWGAGTQRALDNFQVSGLRFPPAFIQALGLVKRSAAETNGELGLLDPGRAAAIAEAAGEVALNRLDDQFPLDVFQTGSATSTHMNANEVIARRAAQILGAARGEPVDVHPNDHVNLGQSSNDVIPTALHVAAAQLLERRLAPALESLAGALAGKAILFRDVPKIGRTHLQDAVPLTLGQEFSGYAHQAAQSFARIKAAPVRLYELALGGTAVGTGMNAHPDFAGRTIARIAAATGLPFREAWNHFEAQAARDACVEAAGAVKTVAVSLSKIANDIRWLASGPRAGLGEIRLPELQPGSSIMPGKVNPVMPEMLLQAAAFAIGADLTVTQCGLGGNFELNTMMPLLAWSLLTAVELLANAVGAFTVKCVDGIAADRERCGQVVETSLALATPLAPAIGYDRAAAIAKEAAASGRTIREVAKARRVLPDDAIDRLIDAGRPRPDCQPG